MKDLTDFTGFDFDAWKLDPDRMRPKTFSFEKSDWEPLPVNLRIHHNAMQSTSIGMTPAELVDLYDTIGRFILAHNLRDHV
jgi:hypothetical protein